MSNLVNKFKNAIRFVQSMGKKSKIALILAIVVLFGLSAMRENSTDNTVTVNDTPEVTLISVRDASTESSPLSLTGSVRSETEAQLRTETQGEVTGVYTTAGSFVRAGTVIAELRNTTERASVRQAEAAVEAAKANLAKATGGARDEDKTILEVSLENARKSLSAAKVSALNSITSAYASVDDAISAKTDGMLSNPDSANPTFKPATSNSQIVTQIIQDRIALGDVLDRHTVTESTLSVDSDLEEEIAVLQDELILVQSYLDNILSAINDGIPTSSVTEGDIATYKNEASIARSSVSAALSAITASKSGLSGSKASVEIAEKNLEVGLSGAQSEDVTALNAAVAQAEAGLDQARAGLARTLIITPISGTVNTLSIRKGEFVSAFTPAATVSNNNALEITTFVTESDKTSIKLGSTAFIDGKYEGVVTSVSPGLDPITKKIEIRVGVVDDNTNLTNGSTVRLDIERNGLANEDVAVEEITIPISALKIETSRTVVFTVDSENILVAQPVKTGLVLGDNLKIEEGLSTDMIIVEDARGLREGQEVTLSNIN